PPRTFEECRLRLEQEQYDMSRREQVLYEMMRPFLPPVPPAGATNTFMCLQKFSNIRFMTDYAYKDDYGIMRFKMQPGVRIENEPKRICDYCLMPDVVCAEQKCKLCNVEVDKCAACAARPDDSIHRGCSALPCIDCAKCGAQLFASLRTTYTATHV